MSLLDFNGLPPAAAKPGDLASELRRWGKRTFPQYVSGIVEWLAEPGVDAFRLGSAQVAYQPYVQMGLVETEEGPLLLLDIAALIAGPAYDRATA